MEQVEWQKSKKIIEYETSGYGMEVNDVLCFTQHSKDIVDAVKVQLDLLKFGEMGR